MLSVPAPSCGHFALWQSVVPRPTFLMTSYSDCDDSPVVQEKLEGQEAVFWPERRYTWGVSEAFNPQHSDLLHLRLLLLKEACDELSMAKRAR